MTTNEINELTEFRVNEKRIERLKRKQAPKTRAQRLKGFFVVLVVVGFICQLLSAVLASSGVFHYLSLKLNSNGLILSITSICILLFIEGSKRFTLESYHAQRIDDNKIHKITYAFIGLWGCLSICSTYYGTPYAIEYFAASPKLVSIDSINTEYINRLEKDTLVLSDELKQHTNTAIAFFEAREWKGRIREEDREVYDKYLDAAKEAKTKLSELIILSNKQKALSIDAANKENNQILKQHSIWCYSFGSTLAVISVILEIVFFLAFWWCENYKRLEVVEAESINDLKTDSSNRTDTINTKGVRLSDTNNGTNTHRPIIAGFQTYKEDISIRTCASCGTDISNKRSDAKFCSTKCRGSHHKAKTIKQ